MEQNRKIKIKRVEYDDSPQTSERPPLPLGVQVWMVLVTVGMTQMVHSCNQFNSAEIFSPLSGSYFTFSVWFALVANWWVGVRLYRRQRGCIKHCLGVLWGAKVVDAFLSYQMFDSLFANQQFSAAQQIQAQKLLNDATGQMVLNTIGGVLVLGVFTAYLLWSPKVREIYGGLGDR